MMTGAQDAAAATPCGFAKTVVHLWPGGRVAMEGRFIDEDEHQQQAQDHQALLFRAADARDLQGGR